MHSGARVPAGSSTRAWLAKEPGGVLVIRVDGVVVARVALAEVVEPKVQSRRVRGRLEGAGGQWKYIKRRGRISFGKK